MEIKHTVYYLVIYSHYKRCQKKEFIETCSLRQLSVISAKKVDFEKQVQIIQNSQSFQLKSKASSYIFRKIISL